MVFETFKGFKKGDRVKFENALDIIHGCVTGEGEIFGFVPGGCNDFAWVRGDDGREYNILLKKIEKI